MPSTNVTGRIEDYVPEELNKLENPQTDLPAIAKDRRSMKLIEDSVGRIPTTHDLHRRDSRELKLEPDSVHLVLTSPPYWTLKEYRDTPGQLGHLDDYADFLRELNKVWKNCYNALVPGGRLICVVGDVCLSRRKNNGRHTVVPLHASIQEQCRKIGYDNLAPIVWHKIANAVFECIYFQQYLELPGYFRAEKKWDLLAIHDDELIAVIEFKAQVGPSFGNNFNNRTEEALGNATDLWAAYREGALKGSSRPWLGYVFILEDCPRSRAPVRVKQPHFEVFPEFENASYAKRYELLMTKLVRERLYDGVGLLLSPRPTSQRVKFSYPSDELSFENFAISLSAHAMAHAKKIE